MAIAQITGFSGANTKVHKRFLPDAVGVLSLNQKPSEQGDFRPWRVPLTISGPVVPSGRQTIYRMGRDTPTPASHWLSWSAVVHAIRGFDQTDTTERTYYTGSGSPKWTDNIQALASTPYPAAARELAVPQPTIAPTVALNTDGPSGDARALYYVYTRVNDIGWESAPSPPVLAPLAKPGAILDLSYTESVPAGNYGVNRVRWYRTQVVSGTSDAEFLFLREYTIASGGQQDDARALGDVLATETWLSLDTSAKWLTTCWNQTASALVGKTVRFCEPNIVYAWPIEYEYALASTPIAQASFSQRLLVLTSAGAEVFTGSDPAAMDQRPINVAPLVSQRSLVVGSSWAAWAADDGLWYYGVDGYRCLTADCITSEQWRALVPSTIAGYYFAMDERELYVGFYNDGSLKGFVVDPRNPNGVYFLSTGYTTGYWDSLLRALFVLEGSTLKQWDAGASTMTATFRGKVARQQAFAEAEWIELLCSGSVTVKVFTDPYEATDDSTGLIERMNRSLTRGIHRAPNGMGGRDYQIEVATTGSLQGVIIE